MNLLLKLAALFIYEISGQLVEEGNGFFIWNLSSGNCERCKNPVSPKGLYINAIPVSINLLGGF